MSHEGIYHRGARPAIGWGGVLLVVVCIIFLIALAAITLFAMLRWARGEPIDLMGFAAVLGQATAAGAAVWSLVKTYMNGRTTQRVEEIRAGAPPPPIFTTPSTPLSDGGEGSMINPHGGPGAP